MMQALCVTRTVSSLPFQKNFTRFLWPRISDFSTCCSCRGSGQRLKASLHSEAPHQSSFFPGNLFVQNLRKPGAGLVPLCVFQQRHYRNFGHAGPPKESTFEKLWISFICLGIGATFIDYLAVGRWLLKVPSRIKNYLSPPRVDALSVSDTDESSLSQSSEEDSDVAEHEQQRDVAKKEKVGFRNRKIIEYENRIRQYSTPDKVFRYFATLVHAHTGEVFMTPADFLRSITPGIQQPEGLGLDQFQRFDPSREKIVLNLPADSIFYHLGSAGLISFSDYIFLLTVLSTSKRHFEIAFQMFDLNGDGDVDAEEFSAVESLLLQNSSIGSKHRDHGSAGTISKGSAASSALSKFFFGPDLREKLTIERFLEFHEQLQREILTLEFQRKDSNRKGTIKPRDFADLLVAYSGFARKKRAKMLKRVSRYFKAEDKKDIELDLEDYLKFFQFVNCIDDVDTALTFYHIAGASINPETFKHVARTVSQVELPDNVVEVIFVLFDEDGDGELSNREFVSVMKRRIQRGLEKSKDTGFIRLLRAMAKCVAQGTPAVLNG